MSIFQVIVAVLTLLTGCVSTGPTDITGKPISYSGVSVVDRNSNRVSFVGDAAPEVKRAELRFRDNDVREEWLYLAGNPKNVVYTEIATTLFDDATTAHLRKAETARKIAADFCGRDPVDVAAAQNVNGAFFYALCTASGGQRCVVAIQGLGMETPAGGGDGRYRAVTKFGYCSRDESADQILQRFAALRIAG